jgi:hypothetical protein
MTGSAKWDERYLSLAQLWSGKPSAALVSEVGELECGRALEVGCGEGEDAVWLAGQGWDASARGVSQVALAWGHSTLGTREGTPDIAAERALFAAVADGVFACRASCSHRQRATTASCAHWKRGTPYRRQLSFGSASQLAT